MNKFIIEDNFLVLKKSINMSKKDQNGNCREYGSISLYCPSTDEFQRILIYENYKEILSKYETNRVFKMKLQVNIVTKDGKSATYIKIL